MRAFHEMMLDVWREACRHIEIGESTGAIARLLVHHMPLGCVVVRRLDEREGCLETVACGLGDGVCAGLDARTVCTGEEMRRLVGWCERRETVYIPASAPREVEMALAAGGHEGRDVLLGPLQAHGENLGVLVLVAGVGSRFDERHAAMAGILLESFAAALENDSRLREMAVLREAAEADKRLLLTRLGRSELGETIVGAESGLRLVMERVRLVARSDAPVLIFGETGTGKELVARAIHKRSPRAAGPVIRVNCGAIPPELIDSQLFGHERGAFTGAAESRKGWFERADGGTLFLDEIGELPGAAQVRLLRVLQDGWLERIGGHQPVRVDVRVVAATHRDLAAMVAEGRFREDLWYRIAVFPIFLPPLRDRLQDIPVLARHFAEKAALRFGLPVLMPTDADMELLLSYSWPGNVRELASVMDRAAIVGNGDRLEIGKALGVKGPSARPGNGVRESAHPANGEAGPFPTLDEAMRAHIESALVRTKGRIEGPFGAAALLDINPHTLRARMRRLGVDWQRFRVQ